MAAGKLTKANIIAIAKNGGKLSMDDLAKKFGVSKATINTTATKLRKAGIKVEFRHGNNAGTYKAFERALAELKNN
jgi:biotin operon repressor